MSISSILDISKRALLSHRSAIDITSKNISNVNTEGYSRRRTHFEELNGSLLGFNHINSQTSGETLTRVHNRFIENQLSRQNHYYKKYEMDEMVFKQVEDIFGEPYESGLANTLTEFWNAWNELANDPESQYGRTIVLDKSVSLAQNFNRIFNDLNQLKNSIYEDVTQKVEVANQKLRQLKQLNHQIMANQSDDLMDQRDLLVREVSDLINLEVREGDEGQVTLFSGGQILVSDNTINELTVSSSGEGNESDINIKIGKANQRVNITSGEIGSLVEMYNEHIPNYIEKLNRLAKNIAKQVNAIHRNGYNLEDTTGINFFAEDISTAGDFRLSHEIQSDPSLIATASRDNEPGNGAIARAIYDLQSRDSFQGTTAADFYNSLVTEIGSKIQESEYLSTSQGKVVQNLQNQKDSVSGVSLDEEMINLTKYEQGYQAAAKVVNTINDMMLTVLNLI